MPSIFIEGKIYAKCSSHILFKNLIWEFNMISIYNLNLYYNLNMIYDLSIILYNIIYIIYII
jgi:hypothetical protein